VQLTTALRERHAFSGEASAVMPDKNGQQQTPVSLLKRGGTRPPPGKNPMVSFLQKSNIRK